MLSFLVGRKKGNTQGPFRQERSRGWSGGSWTDGRDYKDGTLGSSRRSRKGVFTFVKGLDPGPDRVETM